VPVHTVEVRTFRPREVRRSRSRVSTSATVTRRQSTTSASRCARAALPGSS